MNTRRYLLSLLPVLAALLIPNAISASSQDESLRDDVFAMVATSEILNTILVLDTSEQTNAFAYSGYVDTCADAISKLNKSIKLCWQAYNDCQVTNANIGCGGSIDCTTTQTKCQALEANLISMNNFCASVGSADRYAQPGLLETDAECDPATNANSRACRFVGPWNPARDDYEYDLCFYDWASDTGADIPDMADWSYSQYPNAPDTIDGPDRRDWKCLSDTMDKVTRSGLWLNWKFATSLDAMKILLTDDHRFAYEPRRRGATMYSCRTINWKPVDPEGSGKCWQWFDTEAVEGDAAIQSMVRSSWKAEDVGELCTGESGSACEALCKSTNPAFFTADPTPTPAALSSTAAGCSQCFSPDNMEISCDLYNHDPHTADLIPATGTLNASNLRSKCRVFHCAEPKCRDDLTCSSGGCGALGAYSEWDQDINHCCSPLGPGGFECVEGSSGAPTFLPGPGATVSTEFEADFDMVALDLGQGQYYAGAEITTDTSLTVTVLPDVARLSTARVLLFYGCRGETATIKFFEKIYTADATETLANPIPLAGCDTKGYMIRALLRVTHKNDADGLAAARLQITPKLFYDRVTPTVVDVFDPAQSFYSGLVWQPVDSGGGTVQVVKEYECKTIFYSMKSNVVSGGGGACDTPQCDVAGGCTAYPGCLTNATCAMPYTGCTRKQTTTIDKDQWGSATKTLCTFLCPDAPQYDDLWKCMGYFEMNDSLPYPGAASGPGDANITCRVGTDSVWDCCSTLKNYAANYEVFKTFDSNYYEDVTDTTPPRASGTYKCGMAAITEGIANNERRWTGGTHVEITKGHISEVSGGSYLLNPVGSFFKTEDADGNDQYGPTPYAGVDKWYSALALPNYSGSAIASSFVSVFKTGENGTRDPACIYNIVQDLYGEDCDTCGMGCCMMDMGDINYCDYPSFWIKVAKTEGGNIVMEPTSLVGPKLEEFKQKVINLRGVGGSAISETLYDVWRFLGGLKPAYTDKDIAQYATNYPSPIQSDPQCFVNNVILISGGQPNFDSNTTMDGSNFNIAAPSPAPAVPPYVLEATTVVDSDGHSAAEPLSTQTPPESRPYYVANWFLTALPEVATFVHTVDAYHSDLACRNSATTNYRFGFSAAPCAPAADNSGVNVIDRIDTVGIGNWTLAPIYEVAGNNTGYLDPDETLVAAATNGGGNFYGLTAGAATSSGNSETFANLSSLFNEFAASHPGTNAFGKPHFTSSPVQILGKFQTPMNSTAFLTGAIPTSNMSSRFWFGNLKKYYMWQNNAGKTCILGETALTTGSTQCDMNKFANDDIDDDCYNPSVDDVTATVADSALSFNKVMAGGVAKNLGIQLNTCNLAPCYQGSTGRTIYYDNGGAAALVDFSTKTPAVLKVLFNVGDSADVVTILDYVYGYDSVNHDGDSGASATTERRTDLAPLTLRDPFAASGVVGQTVTVPYSILGAIVHSEPLAVYYDDMTDANLRVYVGANDGLLHAFNGVEGAGSVNEEWAYLPAPIAPEMDFILSGVDAVMFNSTVDGPLTLFHIDDGNGDDDLKANGIIDGGEKAYLIMGYRRGIDVEAGSGYYTVLDISDKDTPTFVQHIAISGQSWSKPTIFRKGGTYYLAFGGGYDPCFDADSPSCASPKGAQIHIYAYDGTDFNLTKTFTSADNAWLVAPVAAEGTALNTFGNLMEVDGSSNYTGDTEMVYFVDITGTVFRVYHNGAAWQIKTVMAMRATAATALNFGAGIRSYHSFLTYPPFNKYFRQPVDADGDGADDGNGDAFIVPVPLLTGNLTNPKEQSLQYEIVVLYDILPKVMGAALPAMPDTTNPVIYTTASAEFRDMTTAIATPVVFSLFNGAAVYANLYRGWRINLGAAIHEKGMAAPLAYYNWDYDSYSILATTYHPEAATVGECGNSGSSVLYGRALLEGNGVVLDDRYTQLGLCNSINLGEGLAASPKVTFGGRGTNDEMITASAGSDVYTFSRVQPPPPKTVKILKWYELY